MIVSGDENIGVVFVKKLPNKGSGIILKVKLREKNDPGRITQKYLAQKHLNLLGLNQYFGFFLVESRRSKTSKSLHWIVFHGTQFSKDL